MLQLKRLSSSLPIHGCLCRWRRWYDSDPADIGTTTSQAFNVVPQPGISIAAQMTENAAKFNMQSKSNGSLMRIASLAIFGCHMPAATLTAMAEQEARLSHPNKACQSCDAVYCAAISHLITHPGDATGALEAATAEASNPNCDPDVRKWLLEDSLGHPEDVNAENSIGFCRWGFTLAFIWLRKGTRCVLQCIADEIYPDGLPSD